MSVFRMTGQRPDNAAACSTSAQSALASSTVSENRSVNCRRKLPVPCEQRLFSRNTSRPFDRTSRTENPWLPTDTSVPAVFGYRNRNARDCACCSGTRAMLNCRPSRPVNAAPASATAFHSRYRRLSSSCGSLPCSSRQRRWICHWPSKRSSSTSFSVSAPRSAPRNR